MTVVDFGNYSSAITNYEGQHNTAVNPIYELSDNVITVENGYVEFGNPVPGQPTPAELWGFYPDSELYLNFSVPVTAVSLEVGTTETVNFLNSSGNVVATTPESTTDATGMASAESDTGITEVTITARGGGAIYVFGLTLGPTDPTGPNNPNLPPSLLNPDKAALNDIAGGLGKLSTIATGLSILSGGFGKAGTKAIQLGIGAEVQNTVGEKTLEYVAQNSGEETSAGAVSVGLDVASLFIDAANPIAFVLDAVSFFADFLKPIATKLAADPPDSNYTEVTVPQTISFSLPAGVPAPYGVILNTTIANMLNFFSLSTTILDAAQRYSGAILAGDTASANLQLTAFNKYLPQMENSAAVVGNNLDRLLNILPPIDPNIYPDLQNDVAAAVAAQINAPLPPDVLSVIENATGLDAATINADVPIAMAEFGPIDTSTDLSSAIGSLTESLAALSGQDPLPLTVPDPPSIPNLANSTDENSVAATDLQTPILAGTAGPGSTVTLYDGTTAVGNSTANAQGQWQITSSTLSIGTHILTATATDTQGDVSDPSLALTLTVTSAPIDVPASNSVNVFDSNEAIVANTSNDAISAFGQGDVVSGGPGADTIGTYGNGDGVHEGSGPAAISTFGTATSIVGGAGNDVVNAYGANTSITGGSGFDTISAYGQDASISGGTGPDTVSVYSNYDTVSAGSGNDVISVFGASSDIAGGSGFDTITVYGNSDTITGGSGPDTITVFGQDALVTGAGGTDLITLYGNLDTINGGSGPDTISVFGNDDIVSGGTGADTISVTGSFDTVAPGSGPAEVSITGSNDTVQAGAHGNTTAALVNLTGGTMTFADGPNTYSDTVTGFSESSGDTIKLSGTDHTVALSSQVNGGADTLITLSTGSAILLKGVSHIAGSIFS